MQGFAIPGETGLDRKLKASRLRLEGDFLEVHGSYRYCGRFTGLCRGLLEGSWVVIKWGYKSPTMGYKYSHPTYNPTSHYPGTSKNPECGGLLCIEGLHRCNWFLCKRVTGFL